MIRVLLADDHTMFREGLKQVLAREEDITVAAEAGNGAETLLLLREHQVDVLILDISMPGMSGLDVLGELRREKPALPILVLSMHPEEQYAVRAIKAGASGYLTKQSAPEQLVTAIRVVAQGKKYVSTTVAMQLADAIAGDSEKPLHELLTDREFEVFRLIAAGRPLTQIAEELNLAVATISTFRSRIIEKTGLRSNAEMIRYGIEHGLVE